MRLTQIATFGLAVLFGAAASCGGNGSAKTTAASAPPDTASAGGEVTANSVAPVAGKWLEDGSIEALADVLNQHEIAAAQTEMRAWHSDSVRAFAASMIHDHEAMQHSVDSAAAVLRIAPVMPALGLELQDSLKADVDKLKALTGGPLDRAYLDGEIASHKRLIEDYQELAGATERPQLSGVLAGSLTTLQLHLQRAQMLRSLMSMTDSARRIDSLAARRNRGRR